MSNVCEKCGRSDGQHDYLETDCQLPHSYGKSQHPPQRRIGFCCQGCVTRHTEWVAEIVELYATLELVIDPADLPDERNGEYEKPRKRPASPSPIRLAAWALMHNRVNAKIRNPDNPHELIDAYLGNHLPDVAGVLAAWAQAVFDARDWTDTAPDTVAGAGAVLKSHGATLAGLPDVDTYDAELRWVLRALRAAHGISGKRTKVGDCPSLNGHGAECGGPLYPATSGDMEVRCGRCGRRFGEKFLRLLGGMMSA
ncbi:MAG TPA: hypothetical protein VFH56_15815 [Acidimicrobiales bacterium]|nr:hypothetical protein [Acidimicrobiales bacterium]